VIKQTALPEGSIRQMPSMPLLESGHRGGSHARMVKKLERAEKA